MCCGPQVIPPTEKGMFYKTALKVIMAIQFVIVILNFIAAKQFISQAIFGLFFILIIWMIQHQCSYQGIMLFIFFSIFFAVSFLIYFLTPIQNQVNPFGDIDVKGNRIEGIDKYIYIDSIISFVYYTFVMIFCFYPYREFKAIAFNENPALRNYFEGGYAGDNPRSEQNNEAPKQQNVRNVDYEANYGDINYDRNRRNNQHGTFQVFKGQGVRIG